MILLPYSWKRLFLENIILGVYTILYHAYKKTNTIYIDLYIYIDYISYIMYYYKNVMIIHTPASSIIAPLIMTFVPNNYWVTLFLL
jgi:hypothetical protein